MNRNSSSQSNRSGTGNFYSGSRTPSPSSGSRVSYSVGRSSSSVRSSESTPLSSRDTTQQLITGLAACQRSIEELLQTVRSSNERIEELGDKVKTLDGKLEKLSSDPVDGAESGAGIDGRGKKRKRTKSSLLVQEEVHKLHNSRDPARQYRGRESVTSTHNTKVTQLIVDELCRQGGFSKAAVQRTSKKYHEHLRRTALGKITDEIKLKNKKNLRKERKYERRRAHVKDENESRAFAKLSKEHMSSDDDDTDSEGEGGWVSQPPKYRSKTLETFLKKLDKRSEKAEEATNKRWKRTKARNGEPVEREPPAGTPKWALSDEWKEIIQRREQEHTEGELEGEENSHEAMAREEERGEENDENYSSESDCNFENNEFLNY